jgi:hypothetical protein
LFSDEQLDKYNNNNNLTITTATSQCPSVCNSDEQLDKYVMEAYRHYDYDNDDDDDDGDGATAAAAAEAYAMQTALRPSIGDKVRHLRFLRFASVAAFAIQAACGLYQVGVITLFCFCQSLLTCICFQTLTLYSFVVASIR